MSLKTTFHKSKGKRRKSPTILILNAINFQRTTQPYTGRLKFTHSGLKTELKKDIDEADFMTSPCSRLSLPLKPKSLECTLKNSYLSKVLKTQIISETCDCPSYSDNS